LANFDLKDKAATLFYQYVSERNGSFIRHCKDRKVFLNATLSGGCLFGEVVFGHGRCSRERLWLGGKMEVVLFLIDKFLEAFIREDFLYGKTQNFPLYVKVSLGEKPECR